MANQRRQSKGIASEITMVDNEANGETSPLIGAGAGPDAASSGDDRRESWASDDFLGLPWYKRPSVYWLLGPYFLFTLAFGGVIVPKLNLIIDLVCRGYMADQEVLDPTFTFAPVVPGGDNPQCRIPAVQRNVATFTLMASVLTGALSALVAPKLGSLSDRYGRTSLLTVASCGGVVNEIITIFAAKYPDLVDYHWLLAGAFFDGITGSITAGTILASSYTSDCSPPSKRGVRIGYMHACFFTGLAFGPLTAGYLVKWTGTLLSMFYVALGCHIFFILFIFFITPESLSKKRQMIARQKHQKDKEVLAESIQARLQGTVARTLPVWVSKVVSANPLEPLRILVPSGPHHKRLRRNMVLLALMDAIIISVAMGSGAVTILYVEYIFNWDVLDTSRFVSFMSFTRVTVLLGLFPLVNYIFRIRPLQRQLRESGRQMVESNSGMDELDVWMLRIALVSDVCGTIGYIFSRSPQLFVFSSVVSSVGGLGGAVIQSAITKHVPAERVGSLLGALGLLHALGRVLAPMLFNGIYAATVDTFPQAFFVMLASLFGLALFGSLFIRPHLFLQEDGYVAVPQEETFGIGFGRDEEIVAEAEIASEAFPRV